MYGPYVLCTAYWLWQTLCISINDFCDNSQGMRGKCGWSHMNQESGSDEPSSGPSWPASCDFLIRRESNLLGRSSDHHHHPHYAMYLATSGAATTFSDLQTPESCATGSTKRFSPLALDINNNPKLVGWDVFRGFLTPWKHLSPKFPEGLSYSVSF